MKKNSELAKLISQSQTLRDEFKTLKTSTKVKRYLEIEDKRKQIHGEIADHIKQFNVNTDNLKGSGLVVSSSSWVVIKELKSLAEISKPKIKTALLGLIHSKPTYYTN